MADPKYAHIRFVRLRRQREVDTWLAGIRASRRDAVRPQPFPSVRATD
jgi:hypothetical protein